MKNSILFLQLTNSERLIKMMTDRLVEDGYQQAGYQYVNIDDCWLARQRDEHGRLQADPARFPSGIKGLAKYVIMLYGQYIGQNVWLPSIKTLFFTIGLLSHNSGYTSYIMYMCYIFFILK